MDIVRIDFIPLLKEWEPPQDGNFLQREVLARLFAETIALLALCNAAANFVLFTGSALQVLCAQQLSLQLFESLSETLFNVLCATALFYAVFMPRLIISLAFTEMPPDELELSPLPAEEVEAPAPQVEPALLLEEEPSAFPKIEKDITVVLKEETVVISTPPLPPPEPPKVVLAYAVPSHKAEDEKTFAQHAKAPEPAVVKKEDPYLLLHHPTDKECQAIVAMIKELDTFWPSRDFMEDKRKEFAAVSSIKFLEVLLNMPELRKCLRSISTDSKNWMNPNNKINKMKWSGLLWANTDNIPSEEAVGGALTKLAKSQTLDQLLPGFYKALGVDSRDLEPFVAKKDWSGFLKELIARKDKQSATSR